MTTKSQTLKAQPALIADLAGVSTWHIVRHLAKRHGYFFSVLLNAVLLTYLLVRG